MRFYLVYPSFLVLVLLVITSFGSQAFAQERENSPIFLNKVKSFFSREAEPTVAPLARSAVAPSLQRQSGQDSSLSAEAARLFQAERRTQYLAQKQQFQSMAAQRIQNTQTSVRANIMNAQSAQAAIQSGEGNPFSDPAFGLGGALSTDQNAQQNLFSNQGQAAQPARPSRVIIQKKDDSDNTPKPIFRNFR